MLIIGLYFISKSVRNLISRLVRDSRRISTIVV